MSASDDRLLTLHDAVVLVTMGRMDGSPPTREIVSDLDAKNALTREDDMVEAAAVRMEDLLTQLGIHDEEGDPTDEFDQPQTVLDVARVLAGAALRGAAETRLSRGPV